MIFFILMFGRPIEMQVGVLNGTGRNLLKLLVIKKDNFISGIEIVFLFFLLKANTMITLTRI